MSGVILGCHYNQGTQETPVKWRPVLLLSTLRHTGQPPPQNDPDPNTSAGALGRGMGSRIGLPSTMFTGKDVTEALRALAETPPLFS